jgi:hypothetical protein
VPRMHSPVLILSAGLKHRMRHMADHLPHGDKCND